MRLPSRFRRGCIGPSLRSISFERQVDRMKHRFFLLVLTTIIMLLISACGAGKNTEPTPLPYTPQPTPTRMPTATQAIVGDSVAGQAVFETNCASCHSIEAGVDLEGPSLAGAGSQLSVSYIEESIQTPCPEGPPASEGEKKCTSTMPKDFMETLSSNQFDDVVAYVLSLK